MVNKDAFAKAYGFPGIHSCHSYGNPVHSTVSRGRIAADLFQALTPENLALTSNILRTMAFLYTSPFNIPGTGNSDHRVRCDFVQEKLEKIGLERNIRIDICDQVVRQALYRLPGRVEANGFPGKAAVSSVRHSD